MMDFNTAYALLKWEESAHPRDAHGRFGHGAGGAGDETQTPPAKRLALTRSLGRTVLRLAVATAAAVTALRSIESGKKGVLDRHLVTAVIATQVLRQQLKALPDDMGDLRGETHRKLQRLRDAWAGIRESMSHEVPA
jgi:hypothetical protein